MTGGGVHVAVAAGRSPGQRCRPRAGRGGVCEVRGAVLSRTGMAPPACNLVVAAVLCSESRWRYWLQPVGESPTMTSS